jgi:two-component system, NarL family, nitrate/nitrite response regulator NarL
LSLLPPQAPNLHCFLSKSGESLDAWRQSFPNTLVLPSAGIDYLPSQIACVWLRLTGDATVAEQIAQVRIRSAQNVPPPFLIVMSDIPSDLEALAVFSVGARGYCNAHAGAEVLQNIATVVTQGGMWIGEGIMQRLLLAPRVDNERPNPPEADAALVSKASSKTGWRSQLTSREAEVALAVAEGASNREIATTLGITERTVKAHVGAILEKFEIKSRLQLALIVKDS